MRIRNLTMAAAAMAFAALLVSTGQPTAVAQTSKTQSAASRPTHDKSGRPFAATVIASAKSHWTHETALQGGIEWLVNNQRDEGCWGDIRDRRPADIMLGGLNSLHTFRNASAGLCLLSLLEAERTEATQAVLDKGFAWLIASPLALRVSGTVFYNMWAHAYTIRAMSAGLADETLAKHHDGMRKRAKFEIERLVALQMADGGWGYYDFDYNLAIPSGDQTTSFGTATVLLALNDAKQAGLDVPQRSIDRGVAMLARLSIPNGSWAYSRPWIRSPMGGPSMIEGALCRATACNLAMLELGGGSVEAVRKGLDNLFNHHDYVEIARQRQYPHETWFANAPYYYYYGHYYAALSLKHLDPSIRAEYAGKLAAFVAITADKDGSFWDYPLYGFTKAYGTGYAARIMKLCKDAMPASAAANSTAQAR